MTILEKNKKINELLANGYVETKKENDDFVFKYSLKGSKVHCEERFMNYDTHFDNLMSNISDIARCAYYIEKVLESVGIIIKDIEYDYKIAASSSWDNVFYKKDNNKYTFIVLRKGYICDDMYGKDIRVAELNLDTNELIYDYIDIDNLKYYHTSKQISDKLISIVETWKNMRITQNDFYDVDDEIPEIKNISIPQNLNINKLDKNVFEVEKYLTSEKVRVYCI